MSANNSVSGTPPEEVARKGSTLGLADNQQLAQLVFVKMEDIMDKLKLLNYEIDFCKNLKFKPVSKYVFQTFYSSKFEFGLQALLCFIH